MNTSEIKEKIFEAIAREVNYSSFRPQRVSFGWTPFAIRNRNLFSHLDIVELIVDGLAPRVSKLRADVLVGAETAGVPLAMALALKTRIPFAYVRKEPRQRGDKTFTEGDVRAGQRVALVDDLMTSGASKKLFIDNMTQEGLKTTSIVTIWSDTSTYCKKQCSWIEEQAIEQIYLFTWLELADGLHRHGFIPDDLYPHYIDFIQNRLNWVTGKKEGWHKYVELLNNSGRSVPAELKQWLSES